MNLSDLIYDLLISANLSPNDLAGLSPEELKSLAQCYDELAFLLNGNNEKESLIYYVRLMIYEDHLNETDLAAFHLIKQKTEAILSQIEMFCE